MAEAVADYEEALKYDRSNQQLRADLEELQACVAPADAGALRARGEARFRAGDEEGAREAFTALLGLVRQGVAVAEADRLAALSNRAACCIKLEAYAEALQDCEAALELLLPACGCSGLAALHEWAAAAVQQQAEAEAAPEAEATSSSAGEAQGQEAERGAKLASVSRLLARRGAAQSYLKQYSLAVQNYMAARDIVQRLGQPDKAAALQADIAQLQALMAGCSVVAEV